MGCGCNDDTTTPTPSPNKQCDPCVKETRCSVKMDADCVFYHILNDKPSKLINLGIDNVTSVSTIFEKIDELLGTNFNIPIVSENTKSVSITTSGTANHHIKADVLISAKNGNSLLVTDDGLFASTSLSDGKVKVNSEDVADYLENQLVGGTDGVVSVSTITQDGQVVIEPIISIPNLIEKIKTDYSDLFGTLIYNYLSTQQVYQKLAPYVAYEYYGTLTNFDSSGKGISSKGYDKVYICNGLNGTPDKRGRVAVGANIGVPGGVMDTEVDPSKNVGYEISVNTKKGEFTHALTASENGQHTHLAGISSHNHKIMSGGTTLQDLSTINYVSKEASFGNNSSYKMAGTSVPSSYGLTSLESPNVNIENSGLGVGHNNVQPSIGAIYYMYIP